MLCHHKKLRRLVKITSWYGENFEIYSVIKAYNYSWGRDYDMTLFLVSKNPNMIIKTVGSCREHILCILCIKLCHHFVHFIISKMDTGFLEWKGWPKNFVYSPWEISIICQPNLELDHIVFFHNWHFSLRSNLLSDITVKIC